MRKTFVTIAAAAFAAAFAAGPANADMLLGVTGPITGANASFGAQLTKGVHQAAADINAKGGILGQKIAVEEGDDASDPEAGRFGRQ